MAWLGSTSSTMRYWLAWVNRVAIWRWPKAVCSAAITSAALTPSRAVASRSISTCACRPLRCRSEATSASSGRSPSAATVRATHSASSSSSGVDRVNWYWVRLTRSSMDSSCTGCSQAVMPGTRRSSSPSRRTMVLASALRLPCGLRLISMRPLFSVLLLPSTPMKDDRLATSGSASAMAASACWRSAMAPKEMVCGASVTTWITPLSCTGKKPLGTVT